MPARKRAGDRETESGPSWGTRGIGTPEAVEDSIEMFRSNTDSRVANRNENGTSALPTFNGNPAADRRIAQTILEKVCDNPLDLIRVTVDDRPLLGREAQL